jgi:hypothetical protein
MRFTSNNITSLKRYEIFVFGSNEAGIHGAGAARLANKLFGAEMGKGIGRTGQTYAIPTKNHMIKTLSLSAIEKYVKAFIEESKNYSYLTFLVTEIGCGLAGYTPKDIAPMFNGAPENVILPESFWAVISQECK